MGNDIIPNLVNFGSFSGEMTLKDHPLSILSYFEALAYFFIYEPCSHGLGRRAIGLGREHLNTPDMGC